jgi:hypothetical protein
VQQNVDKQHPSIEDIYCQKGMQALLATKSQEDAGVILHSMLRAFKEEVTKDLASHNHGLQGTVMELSRESKILKKGVVIQNKRIEQLMC